MLWNDNWSIGIGSGMRNVNVDLSMWNDQDYVGLDVDEPITVLILELMVL